MANTASIVALATEDLAHAESSAWARFSAARDRSEFYSGWLAILCTQIERVNGGLLLLGPDAEGAFVPMAIWPDASRDLQHLGPAAERALAGRRGVVMAPEEGAHPGRDGPAHVGYPIEVAGELHGAVVLDVGPCPDAALQRALRLLHWASAWLVDRYRQRLLEEKEARAGRLALAMDIVATALQEPRLGPSMLAVVNELSTRLRCDRVSIGFESAGSIEVEAISHTAVFDPKMRLVRLIGEAMDEALDLDTTIVHPPLAAEEFGAVAHGELLREMKGVAVCSVPLLEDGQAYGVLTLERAEGEAFDAETVALCTTVGGVLGPVLALKRDNERGTLKRLGTNLHEAAQVLVGPRYPGAKMLALLAIAAIAFLSVANGTDRVAAKTVVEGAVQRAIVAPFDGYIAQSAVRAGDTVREGQELVRLDDRDLRLEHTRLVSEREQTGRKLRQALAAQDRGAMAVLSAQVAQSDAQIGLVDDKLKRSVLRAPFNGVVVSGDLSQLLGTPVEQGKLLFQVAPLDAYRVILEVDERDIDRVTLGQTGALTLSAMANQAMDFAVRQITPVSTQQEGRNFFRVEAQLESPSDRVRPGMEGVGKITVGERRLIWIWTHSFVDWLRTWTWKQLP